MTEYFYARISTDKQKHDSQLELAKSKYPNAVVVTEVISGTKEVKPELDSLLLKMQTGDTLIVAGLDRLARRLKTAITIIEALRDKDISLYSDREGADFNSPVGNLLLSLLFSVSTMEADLISLRTKAGLAAARAKGKLIGRPRTKSENLLKGHELVQAGMSVAAAAREVDLSRQYLSKFVNQMKTKGTANADSTDTPNAGGTKVG